MKNRFLFFCLLLMLPPVAEAQVNLDQPLAIGDGDQIFASSVEADVAYLFPSSLVRVSEVKTSDDNDRAMAEFDVGVSREQLAAQQVLVSQNYPGVKLRVLRALKAEWLNNSSTDIDERFDPKFYLSGDYANLIGPTPYAFSVNIFRHLFTKSEAQKLFERLFGRSVQDHVGTLRIEFIAQAFGKPRIGSTAIPIFAGTRSSVESSQPVRGFKSNAASKSSCWRQERPGEICLL